MTWPGWTEPVVLGWGEVFAILLAHGIVLGIAWVRWYGGGEGEASSCPEERGG